MKSDISKTLIAVTLVSLMFLTFGGLAHYAQAVTVITVDDEASCEALPLRDPANPDVLVGNPTWDSSSHTCQIPEETELQIRDDEVLDLHVSIINAGSIRNLNGVIDIAARSALNTWMGGVENYGIINIRAGAELAMGDASFFNSRDAIVNNYGEIAGSSDNPRFTNVGTINNFDTGRIRTHGEMRLYNDPQGVINNYGFINIDLWGLVNDGIINNFATAIVRHGGEGGIGTPAPRQGTLINFGSMEISSGFFDSYHNVETISNHGVIQITSTSPSSADVFNDGTIINQAEGVIENFAKFRNPGVINNQGLIAIYCGGTFINTGTFTGTPIKNSCESVPPAITAPSDTTLTTTGTRLNPCQNIGVAGISAIGDDGGGNVATNTR